MEKTEKKQFKELSEEQLKEVTGGIWPLNPHLECRVDIINCPSHKYDMQCNCLG